MCVYGLAQQNHVALQRTWPSHVSVRGPWTQHRGNLIPPTKKNKKKTEGMRERERKEERINQARRKTKATGQGGPKCHLASTWGEKRGGEKKKGSLEFTRGKFSFFSWTAECLIMGLDLTSAPLGMWNRGLVVMGGRVWGMMWVGR